MMHARHPSQHRGGRPIAPQVKETLVDEGDQKLVDCLARWRQGDSQARDELLSYSCERLRKLASQMLRGYPNLQRWEQTGDVLQNAMLRLHRSLGEVKPESTAHFFRLAALQIRRELIDLVRHHFGPQGAGGLHETNLPDPHRSDQPLPYDRPDTSSEPANLMEWAEFHEQHVKSLPDEEREVFNLIYYQGMSHREAAEVLHVSVRTVDRRWLSACLSLQAKMQGRRAG